MASIVVLFIFSAGLLTYESRHRMRVINSNNIDMIPRFTRFKLERRGVARRELVQAYAAESSEGVFGFMMKHPVLSAFCYCLGIWLVLLTIGLVVV